MGRFEQELRKVHAILEQLEEGDMILLNEPFTSTQRITAVAILKELVLKFHCRGCVGGLVTHFYEIAEILPRECFYSLAAEVVQGGDGRERTFRIVPRDPYCQSYARDIAAKCGATYEQLMEAMGFGEGVSDNA